MKKFIEFRGNQICCQATGKGPAVVLIHGFLESSAIWKNLSRRLSKDFRVITLDLPGHGESGLIEAPSAAPASGRKTYSHSIDLMAEMVHHVLKNLDVTSCVMVGHSMGGYVTLAFAEKYARKLKGFVLFHSHAAADSPEALVARERTIGLVKNDHQHFISHFIPELFDPANVKKFSGEISRMKALSGHTPKEAVIAALEGMKTRPDRTHMLANVNMPVLFIIGKNDSRIPLQAILPQTILPRHSESLILDQVGHMGFIEAPGKTFEALKGFAARCF